MAFAEKSLAEAGSTIIKLDRLLVDNDRKRDVAIARLEKALEEGSKRREERDAALSRIAELEAALEPFKKAADNFDSMPVKDPESWFAYSGTQSHTEVMGAISVGDLRRARSALRK